LFPQIDPADPHLVAKAVFELALSHLEEENQKRDLYRIFFYDCAPLLKLAHLPVSRRAVNFTKTPQAIFRLALHNELRGLRKVALRLGHLMDHGEWRLKDGRLTQLLNCKRRFEDMKDEDFE